MTIAVAYIPVLHQGYIRFLSSQHIDVLLLLSPEVIPADIEYLHKDIRAVSVADMQRVVQSLGMIPQVEIATDEVLRAFIANAEVRFILPNDDISGVLVAKYFSRISASQIEFSPIFLRWDKKNATENKLPVFEQDISSDELVKTMFDRAYHEAGKSSDWWRHVGAVVVRDGQPLLTAYNRHLPSEEQQYFDGDARALFHAGEQIELTTAIHAEANLIAHAARAGLALEGCELFVTTFPCPPCAKLIAASGIKKLYFAEGYAVFDGEEILKSANVEIIKVSLDQNHIVPGDTRSTVVPYPAA